MNTISAIAQEYMVKLEHQQCAGVCVTPNTAKAGASKADRDALAELKKAKLIQTYKNEDCPEGHTVFRFTKEGKYYLKSIGVDTMGLCIGIFSTYYGGLVDTRPNYK